MYIQVRERVGHEGKVIGAVSGGVDSTVAAMLLKAAIGDRFHAILVDNGCLRKNEAKEVTYFFMYLYFYKFNIIQIQQ
jgi:GMP synthase (glutamine-hydrolysing)